METDLAPGDRAPAFKLKTDSRRGSFQGIPEGQALSSSTSTPKTIPPAAPRKRSSSQQAKRKFDAAGITVIGVSKDSIASHEKFRAKHKLKIVLGVGLRNSIAANAFGVWVEKSLYGRKYMGMDRATFLVDAKGVIRQVWRKVKVPGHVEAVLAAAKAL